LTSRTDDDLGGDHKDEELGGYRQTQQDQGGDRERKAGPPAAEMAGAVARPSLHMCHRCWLHRASKF
jgi:hypothetical protein